MGSDADASKTSAQRPEKLSGFWSCEACHSFPIDLEELHDLGLPAPPTRDAEVAIVNGLTSVLVKRSDELRLIEIALPEEIAEASSPRANGHDGECEAA